MTSPDQLIEIQVLDRTYSIKCPAAGAAQLQESAKYLDDQMKKLRQSTGLNNTERLAIVAALNVCHELMQLKRQKNDSFDVANNQVKDLQQRIQQFLGVKESVPA